MKFLKMLFISNILNCTYHGCANWNRNWNPQIIKRNRYMIVEKKFPLFRFNLFILRINGNKNSPGIRIHIIDYLLVKRSCFIYSYIERRFFKESLRDSIQVIMIPILLTKKELPEIIWSLSKWFSIIYSYDFSFWWIDNPINRLPVYVLIFWDR